MSDAGAGHTGRLTGALFTECAEWIWEQLQEDGIYIAGELVELILETERELQLHTAEPATIAPGVHHALVARGIAANPAPLDERIIVAVLEWEDEFLGFAGIPRAES